jgi:hypothetical protein
MFVLILMFATFVVAGVVEHFVPEGVPGNRAIALSHTIVFTILCASWCQADAASRASTLTRGTLWSIVLLLPIGLSYYLFRSRRPREALRALALSLCFFLVLVGGAVGGYALAEALHS